MFTGLVQTCGIIVATITNSEGKQLAIKAPSIVSEITVGDSVSVNGVCLTVTDVTQDVFIIQAVHVTLKKTTIGMLDSGSSVNLELALKVQDRVGGHFVQGHVNGLGKIESVKPYGDNYEMTISIDQALKRYMIKEGSVALDGISLTIADCHKKNITVSIIPHTWQVTNLNKKKVGDFLNIEVDILAKYVEQFMRHTFTKEFDYSILQEQVF